MKIAVFHDYFVTLGGAEKVAITIAEALGADLITTVLHPELEKLKINLISLGEVPTSYPMRQIFASLKFFRDEFADIYDFFIFSGNFSQYSAVKNKPNLWYCHAPYRPFYDLYPKIFESLPPILRESAKAWAFFHRFFDKKSLEHVEKILANSKNTRRRILRYYSRDSKVVYPPINFKKFKFKEYGDFWLSVNRISPEKRINLQIDVFRRIPEEKLIIVGETTSSFGEKYKAKVLHNIPDNVEIRGFIPENELLDLYSRCKGVICTALDEDFGMVPLEAMASGKPVVATREGGYAESVVHNVTGKLVGPTVEEIKNAVLEVSRNPEKYKKACIKRAKLFDKPIFIRRIRKEISYLLQRL